MARASARQVSALRTGRRWILRNAMRKEGPDQRAKPNRSKSDGWKRAGGSGRIASAGGNRTARRTAPATPAKAAPALTAAATPSTP